MINKNHIIEYYDKSKVAYQDIWHLDTAMALHYGFWEKGVTNLKQALIKENEVVVTLAKITPKDKVLDAGCGVGGSSFYLAQNIGCSVHGISLSKIR
ncbi:MAG: SAM-dependent methyltransferase [Salibacteraceae bacterium]